MACLDGLWQLLGDALGDLAQLTQRPVGLQPGQRTRQGTHRVLRLPVVLRRERDLRSMSCSSRPVTWAEAEHPREGCCDLFSARLWECSEYSKRPKVAWSAHLLVVVEDDNHVLVQETCMVHGLVGHATRDSPVSYDCHTVVLPALQQHMQLIGLGPQMDSQM